jgi:hypothetical protein
MNGGGTIIGPGRRWSDHHDFPVGEQPNAESTTSLAQAELFAALGISKGMMRSKQRGDILKTLVAEGVLLSTGQPNPEHPKVVAISRQMKSTSSE